MSASLKHLLVPILMMVSRFLATEGFFADDSTKKYQWTISFTVSDIESEPYQGTVQVVLLFDDANQENFVASNDQFVKGSTYQYTVKWSTDSNVQYAAIRTVGMCNKPLRLSRISFASETRGATYSKLLFNVPLKDKCQGSRGLALTDFSVTSKFGFCITEDQKRYEDGDQFTLGCEAKCRCNNGRVNCVDLCPAFGIKSALVCQRVNVVGECCPTIRCEGTLENRGCHILDQSKFSPELNYGYPSSVYVCGDKECTRERTGAVLLSNNWALAPYVDNWNTADAHLFIARPSESGIRRFGIEQMVSNETAGLTLFKMTDYAPSSLKIQQANLPSSSESCWNSLSRTCPFTMVGWHFASADDESPNMKVHVGNAVDLSQCSSETGSLKQSAFCMANFTSNNTPCRMQHGGPVFVQNDKDVNYLVGMKPWRSKKLNDCQTVAARNEMVVNLCPSLDWIRQTLNNRPNF